MPIYLCREGHKQRSQEAAVNCGYCKRNHRKVMEANRDATLNRVITTMGCGKIIGKATIGGVKKVIVRLDTGCIRRLEASRLTFNDDGWHYKELEFVMKGKATVAFE